MDNQLLRAEDFPGKFDELHLFVQLINKLKIFVRLSSWYQYLASYRCLGVGILDLEIEGWRHWVSEVVIAQVT